MSKRSVNDSLDKIVMLVDGNNSIAVNLQNKILRHINSLKKKTKPTNRGGEKPPGSSQFEKPMNVSPEMCEFANWEKGCHKSRTDVTKVIWQYVTDNNLKFAENKRKCTLDSKLKELLGLDVDNISYPQIQKYIGKHLTNIVELEPPIENDE